jgi:hypothetical protein
MDSSAVMSNAIQVLDTWISSKQTPYAHSLYSNNQTILDH